MSLELNLRFPDPRHLIVTLDQESTGPLDFVARLKGKDREEIRWYLETYAALYTTDPDDAEARRIEAKLPKWGTALFEASFRDRAARRLFNLFQDTTDQDRLLTISTGDSTILSLPWELLRDPKGIYLFNQNPRISIRRRVAKEPGGRWGFEPKAKRRLRLLFVVSRPSDAGFMDPRSEPRAVMDAVEQHAPGRIEVEFLRPATFRNLVERLEDKALPTVDIIHFDGHGAFDTKGSLGDRTPNTGYLLFERDSGLTQFVSPEYWYEKIGDYKVPLVILSACQSAALSESEEGDGTEEPMGSFAYGLTALGVPAVLAMTHSLLVETAGQLFGEFYRHLAEGQGVGAALDKARHHLMQNPEKHEVQRGSKRIRLTVQDWFLPALYQAGRDVPLLDASMEVTPTTRVDVASEHAQDALPLSGIGLTAKLPELQKAGFFGRQRELWDIEYWFVRGTRRISITGFGGQGKTYMAAEAGRWLRRTGMFECVAFVDYAAFQGVDALGYAIATLGTVLGTSLTDANAAAAALKQTPTLVILDNLGDLTNPQKPAMLAELLNAGKIWSECGSSRVLITSRVPNFNHADYPFPGNQMHRGLTLGGLGQDDALSYFQSLMELPPEPKYPPPDRRTLLKLFEMVSFHPLSIHLLAVQLKTRRAAELGPRLESLLAAGSDERNRSLRASLQLLLDRLDKESQQSLWRLGVMQNGAMEHGLMIITESPLRFIQANFPYDILGNVSIEESKWTAMVEQLHAAALVAYESLDGVVLRYVRFHPTLAPLLWSQLPQQERDALTVKHRLWYYQLSSYLYNGDPKHPHQMRVIAQRELPNLLHAVHGALETGEEWAVRFSFNVVHFLNLFGLSRDAAELTERTAAWRENGSIDATDVSLPWQRRLTYSSKEEEEFKAWRLAQSNRGKQLLEKGDAGTAAKVFQGILDKLEDSPSLERCSTLDSLGRCFDDLGKSERAEMLFRDALAMADNLEPSENVQRQRGMLQTDLGDVLTDMGRYAEARVPYDVALAIFKELGDLSREGTVIGQIGTLTQRQGDLPEAARRHGEAISIFQRLNEPAAEAVYRHQLGMVFHQAGQWKAAEEAYRESARIRESLGDLPRAADAWALLGQVNAFVGKPEAAEAWFRKALETRQQAGDRIRVATTLADLAMLIQNQRNRLVEARQLAEESLDIMQSLDLDPGAAEIWNNYTVLAQIARKQNNLAQAREYRRQAQEALRNFPGSRDELEKHRSLISAIIITVFQPRHRRESEPVFAAMQQQGRAELVAALRRILDGERDVEALCESLGPMDSMIVDVILNSIKDPANRKALLGK